MLYRNALIIDDDPIFRLVAEDALRALGIETIDVAKDGVEGLKAITNTKNAYDLVLCDLQMPNLDGVSVVRELAHIKYSGALIIVSSEAETVISAVQRMAIMVGIRILGAIKKPLTVEALKNLLSKTNNVDATAMAPPTTRHALKQALTNRQVVPYYQPKLCIKTQKATAAEVLARFKPQDGEPIVLASALKAAEQYGLMQEFTFIMIDQVIEQAKLWKRQGIVLDLSINISPAILCNLDLPDILKERFTTAKIDLQSITLEVTEERLLDYDANVLEVLSRLRLLGFNLSIDDFGTGATSIEQLRLYPFNELKIDKSFIQGAQADLFAKTTVEASVRLASMLDMKIVAEGVETKAEYDFIRNAGAHMAQGFLVSEALPADEFCVWLNNFNPNALKAA